MLEKISKVFGKTLFNDAGVYDESSSIRSTVLEIFDRENGERTR